MIKRNPLPNEHAARQKPPELFKTFRRSKSFRNKPLPTGISVIYGIGKEKGPRGGSTEIQSFRFDKNKWGVREAKKWLKNNGFETKIEKARKKKIIKNPYDKGYIELLKITILVGHPEYLSNAISYGSQRLSYGSQRLFCDDCDKIYDECECEKCPDCDYNRCMCDLRLNKKSFVGIGWDKTKFKVRKKAWYLAKKTLLTEQLNDLRNSIFENIYDPRSIISESEKDKLEIEKIIKL